MLIVEVGDWFMVGELAVDTLGVGPLWCFHQRRVLIGVVRKPDLCSFASKSLKPPCHPEKALTIP